MTHYLIYYVRFFYIYLRGVTNRREVPAFMAGDAERGAGLGARAAAGEERALQLAGEVFRDELSARDLTPSVRTEYRRTAFQLPSSNAVRVSLDSSLAFSDGRWEFSAGAGAGGAAPATPQEKTSAAAVGATSATRHFFPFAILEVKLQDEEPSWVADVLSGCPSATEVHKFSKFLHGTQLLRGHAGGHTKDASGGVQRVPHWLTEEAARHIDR